MATQDDVNIIGAGIVGCAIACELSRRGVPVRVLDARAPGRGATQASGGILAPYIAPSRTPASTRSPRRPLVGPSTRLPGPFYAAGHHRHGIMLAPLTAELTADYLVDDRRHPLLDLMRPDRFGEL
jgi:glycine/D-amino acid oxidase-like deaminating enzyme